jgi:DNA-binding transcriptional MerR regulator
MTHPPNQIATTLGISPATLRLWSKHFAEHLSDGAALRPRGDKRPRQRRYTDADVAVLREAGHLLTQGLTYEQVKTYLPERLGERSEGTAPTARPPTASSDNVMEEQAARLAEQARTIALLENLLQREQQARDDAARAAERLLEAKDAELAAKESEVAAHRQLARTQRRQVLTLGERVQMLERELTRREVEGGKPNPERQNPWGRRLLEGA